MPPNARELGVVRLMIFASNFFFFFSQHLENIPSSIRMLKSIGIRIRPFHSCSIAATRTQETFSPGRSHRLKGKLRQAIEEDPEDELIQKNTRETEKQAKREKIENAKAVTEKQKELFSHLDDYLSDVRNVISTKTQFFPKHPSVYKYLGTSEQQVKNPYLVSDEVRKLLKKNKVARAVFLVRLAGPAGSVGMNMILRYLTKENKNKLALKVHNMMKKWGAKDTGSTHVQLLPSEINRPLENGKKVDRILSSFQKIKEKTHPSEKKTLRINANATLNSLSKSGAGFDTLREFYDEEMTTDIKDQVSYSTMLNSLAELEENEAIGRLKDSIWAEIQGRSDHNDLKIDARLLRAYLNSISNSKREEAIIHGLDIFNKYFYTPKLNTQPSKGKFPITAAEFDIWLRLLVRLSKHEECIGKFEEIKSNHVIKLDVAHYGSYIQSISQLGDTTRSVAVLRELKDNKDELSPPSTTFAQLLTVFMHCDPAMIDVGFIENSKKLCQKHWGKRPHISLLESYSTVYNYIFSPENLEKHSIHPREGVHALNEIALSYQVLAHNLTQGTNIAECKGTLKNTAQLCDNIYNHRSWKKHKFIWVFKMKQMFEELLNHMEQQDKLDTKAVENFVYDVDTIVKRQTSKFGRAAKASRTDKKKLIMPAF